MAVQSCLPPTFWIVILRTAPHLNPRLIVSGRGIPLSVGRIGHAIPQRPGEFFLGLRRQGQPIDLKGLFDPLDAHSAFAAGNRQVVAKTTSLDGDFRICRMVAIGA